ncbi:MAG: potassium channel protein [Bacteroidota bacterium]
MDAELRNVYDRLKSAAVAFMIVLIAGTVGYRLIVRDSSWWDCMYMTFITVTTIGFEEVIELDDYPLGRMFTIFIAFSGIGVFTYAFSNVAALFIENDLSDALKKARAKRAVDKMSGHYIICGGSRVGRNIALELERTQRTFVLADSDPKALEELAPLFKYGKILVGDCTEEDFLLELGLQRAKGVFVTTRNDNINLVIIVTIRQLNKNIRTICHCKEVESESKLRAVGANRIVLPSIIGGMRMASEMVRPTVTTFLDEMLRDEKNLRIEEVTLASRMAGQSVSKLCIDDYDHTLLLALREGTHWEYNPPANYRIKPNSQMILMTNPEDLQALRKRFCEEDA